jgi:DMSO/TMAO reductase YedYZ molybdopterin-dependent catalytic subunit
VLEAAGVKSSAVYTGHEGADPHLSGDPSKVSISRGVPIAKAMDPNNLIAFEMNGEPIPAVNGFPVRLVIPGWPGSCSQKWLTRVWVRDKVHDGEKMGGMSYRVPKYNVAPGTQVPREDFKIMESMPVKSVITSPADGVDVASRSLEVRGHAWAGDRTVAAVHVSIDFGATWTQAVLSSPPNPFSWQRWRARLAFPERGYYEVWARATDDHGVMQPFAVNWNPRGYMNNSMHRIALKVA